MTGLSIRTLVETISACETEKQMALRWRKRGDFGIAVEKDSLALWWQRRDRLEKKARVALLEKAERQEQQIKELGARVRELEAAAERDEKVIAAAQRLISSKKRLVSQAGTDCVTLAAFGEWSEDETALDAALAARDAK